MHRGALWRLDAQGHILHFIGWSIEQSFSNEFFRNASQNLELYVHLITKGRDLEVTFTQFVLYV